MSEQKLKLKAKKAIQTLGITLEQDVKDRIIDGPFQALAQPRNDKHGSDNPLNDTGHLKQSIRYVID